MTSRDDSLDLALKAQHNIETEEGIRREFGPPL
jgi:hypothetical protein